MGMMNRKELLKMKPGERCKPKTVCGPGRTKQEFREETDVNKIMARFKTTGQITHLRKMEPQFMDCTNVPDFGTMYLKVRSAEDSFRALPARVRARFENDPAQFYEFLRDDRNYDEAVQLGLVKKKEEPKAPEPEVKPGKAVKAESKVETPKEAPPAS